MTYRTKYKSEDIFIARKQLGWSQAKLAQRSGFTRWSVAYWEKQKGWISSIAVSAFAETLEREGISIASYKPPCREIRVDPRQLIFTEPELIYAPKPKPSICGAATRKGKPCIMKPIAGKNRCKFHGGMSTGARTPEGIERIRQAQIKRWSKNKAEKKAA